MSDLLDLELRAAFEAKLESLPGEREARLCAFDYRARTRRHRRRWAAVGALGTALAGGVATAALLLSSGASVAYAGWSAVPTTPTPAALATAIDTCRQLSVHFLDRVWGTPLARARSSASRCAGQPVLTDARGKYVALIYAEGGDVNEIITPGNGGASSSGGPIPAAPAADRLSSPNIAGGGAGYSRNARLAQRRQEIVNLEALEHALAGSTGSVRQLVLQKFHFSGLWQQLQGDTDAQAAVAVQRRIALAIQQDSQLPKRELSPDPFGDAYGRAGSDVSAVTFTFANGKTVAASVEHGWYFAWWPWTGFPTSAEVTTSAGTVTSPMPGSHCNESKRSCVFVGPVQD